MAANPRCSTGYLMAVADATSREIQPQALRSDGRIERGRQAQRLAAARRLEGARSMCSYREQKCGLIPPP
jgi:hypothetical protein